MLGDGGARVWGLSTHGQAQAKIDGGDVALPRGRRCVGLGLGAFHSLALLDDGRILQWGTPPLGTRSDDPVPVELGQAGRAVSVAAGWWHSAAAGVNGELWTWGSDGAVGCTVGEGGGGGRLGRGLAWIGGTDVRSPTRVHPPGGWRALSVACGPASTAVLVEEGEGE